MDALHAESKERLAEIAQILTAGLMRLRGAKSTRLPADRGESSLDFTRHQSGGEHPGSQEVDG